RSVECFVVSPRCGSRVRGRDRAIHSDDVVPLAHHHAPPVILEVALQLDTERAVIPNAVKATVDFTRLEDKTAPLAEASDFLHSLCVNGTAHKGNLSRGLRGLRRCPKASGR